jgi:hypothetical protein
MLKYRMSKPRSLQLLDEACRPLDGVPEGLELGDLGPYVLVHPDDVHVPVPPGPLGQLQRLVHRDAELVPLPASRDVVVAAGVHVGVDPQRDAGPLPDPGGELLEPLELGGRLDVEEQDALPEPGHELRLGLPDAREDHLLRVEPGPHRPVELPAGDYVGAGPEGRQRPQHGEVPVRLDRVADQVVEAREGLVELPVGPLYRGVAVDVGRRPRLTGDLVERYPLAAEAAPLVVEVVQDPPPRSAVEVLYFSLLLPEP